MSAEKVSENLPQILPPEESEAAKALDNVDDLAEQESAWIEDTLSPAAIEHETLKNKLALERASLRNELAKAYITNLDSDRQMREKYAGEILNYLKFYSGGVGIVLVLAGFERVGFSLEQGVLTTLVGSTAVAAIGLVGFIARGLFRSPPSPPVDTKNEN